MAVSITSSNDVRKKLQLAFDLYDKNDNGKFLLIFNIFRRLTKKNLSNFFLIIKGRIDKKEMEKMLIAIYDLNGETNRKGDNDPKSRTEAIFRKMDRDYSNTLSESEFIEGCLGDPVLMRLLNPQI